VDEVYIARHLVPAGSEVAVGAPILITVEDPADVAAFESYTLPAETAPTTPTTPATKEAASPPPAPEVKVSIPEEVKQIPVKPLPPTSPPTPKAPVVFPSSLPSGQWGSQILNSPLLQKLIQEQNSYRSKYGESLHQPLATKTSGGEK
jgi:pyruvate/2-oxoglutarate dehydrogenase complex dihydrolipoamide acyltransferase (E2) component